MTNNSPMLGIRTDRRIAAWLALSLCVVMTVPAIFEWVVNPQPSLRSRFQSDLRRFGLQLTLQEVERHLVYESQFASAVRQPYQRFLVARFGQGSRNVIVGRDGYLFHRTDLANTAGIGILWERFLRPTHTGPDLVDLAVNRLLKRVKGGASTDAAQPKDRPLADSLAVISGFHHALAQRGVHLIVVGVPGKSTIYPEFLRPEYSIAAGPPWNSDYTEWRRRLVAGGVDYVDLMEPFWAQRTTGDSLFLKLDTHWSPRGVALAARLVADRVRGFLEPYPPHDLATRQETIVEPADLIRLLGLRHDATLYPERPLGLTELVADSDVPAGDDSPVLLFGDSLSGYYDGDDASELGQGAGFASQLMRELKTGVQRFVGFGADLPGTIQQTLDTRPNVLTHKRVVVLEFHLGQLAAKTFFFRLSVP